MAFKAILIGQTFSVDISDSFIQIGLVILPLISPCRLYEPVHCIQCPGTTSSIPKTLMTTNAQIITKSITSHQICLHTRSIFPHGCSYRYLKPISPPKCASSPAVSMSVNGTTIFFSHPSQKPECQPCLHSLLMAYSHSAFYYL